MKKAILRALLILVGLSCAWASQEQQAKPPGVAAGDPAEASRAAGDKADSIKPNVGGAPVDSSYEIGPEDVITVWVYQQPSMIGQYTVRTDGMVSIPLIGEIKAGGLKTRPGGSGRRRQTQNRRNRHRSQRDRECLCGAQQKVYVSGDGITRTGFIDLVVATHVSEVIAAMGGFRDFAKKTKIRIVRQGPDGKAEIFHYNDNEVSHGKKLEQNILLKPGDHVYVD